MRLDEGLADKAPFFEAKRAVAVLDDAHLVPSRPVVNHLDEGASPLRLATASRRRLGLGSHHQILARGRAPATRVLFRQACANVYSIPPRRRSPLPSGQDVAKFLCSCGDQIRTSGEIPHPYEWLLISDLALQGLPEPLDWSLLYKEARHFFRCGNCGRLWVFWQGFDGPPTVYRPESGPLPA